MAGIPTILVADEVPLFRDLARRILAPTGRVLCCETGAQALETARRERPSLVLADLRLPDMDAEELCRRMQQDRRLASVPVLVLSGSDLAADRARVLRAGARDVLPKPLSQPMLVEGVSRFLHTPEPRGLPRVHFEEPVPVRIEAAGKHRWGRVGNLSRSGMFVETDSVEPLDAEIDIEFCIPEAGREFTPSARVVWYREGRAGLAPGMGLAFLALDRPSSQRLNDYVSERVATPRASALPA